MPIFPAHRSLNNSQVILLLRSMSAAIAIILLFMGCSTPQQVLQEAPTEEVEQATEVVDQARTGPVLTLEDIHASGKFSGEGFQGGRWTSSGPVVTFVDFDRSTRSTSVQSYNLETESTTTIIDGKNLVAPDTGNPILIEDYGISEKSGLALLYTDSERVWRQNTKGFYYVLKLETGEIFPLSDREEGYQMFAKASPDGKRVAFVRNRDLWMVDISTREETRLTFDGSDDAVINGTFDWVYEEEFGLRDGWSWSPDSRFISFFQLDETAIPRFEMADLRGQYPDVMSFKYPKAGEDNSEVRIGILDVTDLGQPSFFETGTWKTNDDTREYICQMGWTPTIDGQSHVWMMRIDRDQNDLELIYGNPETLQLRTILTESEETWIEVEAAKLTFLEDGVRMMWQSENDGFNHLYLSDLNGGDRRQITSGDWEITSFHGIKGNDAYFTATIESSMERHLYRQSLDPGSTPVKITSQPGWHSVDLSGDLSFFIDRFSTESAPTSVTLHDIEGNVLRVLQSNRALAELIESYDLPAPEFLEIPGAEGSTLNAYLIKPNDFDPAKTYPVLVHAYGGPGSQEVVRRWGGTERLWHQMLATEHGIIIAGIDARGTGGKGKAFKNVTYKKLGVIEALDQIAAAGWLADQPYVDSGRIGIWGWSYGGFLTLMAMLTDDGPSTIKLGISVAPVSSWRQYDTIYTERFMSTPQKNSSGYDRGAPVTYAENLSDDQKLLIVHGDYDDNVHFQNTVQMVDALQKNNKQFDLMVYPGRNHGIYGGKTRLHLYTLMTRYLLENL